MFFCLLPMSSLTVGIGGCSGSQSAPENFSSYFSQSTTIKAPVETKRDPGGDSFLSLRIVESKIFSMTQIGDDDQKFMLVYSGLGCLESKDRGDTWTIKHSPLASPFSDNLYFPLVKTEEDGPIALVPDPFVSGAYTKPRVSHDRGKTWQETSSVLGLMREQLGPYYLKSATDDAWRTYGVWMDGYSTAGALRSQTIHGHDGGMSRIPGEAGWLETFVSRPKLEDKWRPDYSVCYDSMAMVVTTGFGAGAKVYVACNTSETESPFASAPLMSGLVKLDPDAPASSPSLILPAHKHGSDHLIHQIGVNSVNQNMVVATTRANYLQDEWTTLWLSFDEGGSFDYYTRVPEQGVFKISFSDEKTVILQDYHHDRSVNNAWSLDAETMVWSKQDLPDPSCRFFSAGPKSIFCYGHTLFRYDQESQEWKDLTGALGHAVKVEPDSCPAE